MFKALAFRNLCLVPNKIDFVFSWPKCTLNLSLFNFSYIFYAGKPYKYCLHKVTNH